MNKDMFPPTGGALVDINDRSREIFRRIVESYLATGEPVGSRNLSRILPMSLSPASVRNVMADLEGAGLIYAPHTSAGRLPTEQGLRFFVDALMEVGDVSAEDRSRIEAEVKASGQNKTTEGILSEASALLSGLSRGAGVVATTKASTKLKHIEFVRLDPARALGVLVAEDGSVENRILELPPGLPASALVEASNYLSARVRGKTLADLAGEIESERSRAEVRARFADRRTGRKRTGELERPIREPPAHRAGTGQPAGRPESDRGSRADQAALCRS